MPPERIRPVSPSPRARLRVEELESRWMPAIRLDLVALHEFGHALGLGHNNNPASIMYAYYNANYDVANFATDPAAQQFAALYGDSDLEDGAWKDSLDPHPGDSAVEITYSFTPDGAKMDSGKKNTLFATMNGAFGAGNWQSIFARELGRWAAVTGGRVVFTEHADGGQAFNVSGDAQNDSRFGDIRIGAHRFDGPGRTLAHTYFPPPNGATAAGDAHFDQAESWSLSSGGLTGPGGGGGGGGNLTLGNGFEGFALPVDLAPGADVNIPAADSGPDPARGAAATAAPVADATLPAADEAPDAGLPALSWTPEAAADTFAVLGGGTPLPGEPLA